MSTDDEVRAASEQFYAALNRVLNGDADPMADIWSQSVTVTAMHPLGGRQVGWTDVADSFQQVAGLASGGQVEVSEQLVQVAGDMAYELGVERGRVGLGGKQIPIEHRVTNVYRREGGAWRIVHHHTDVNPGMVELLKSVKPEG
jgi:ketosteroid isomerase-like protein